MKTLNWSILLAPGQSRQRAPGLWFSRLRTGSFISFRGPEVHSCSLSPALRLEMGSGALPGSCQKWQHTMVSAELILPFTLVFCSQKYSNPTFRQRCRWGKQQPGWGMFSCEQNMTWFGRGGKHWWRDVLMWVLPINEAEGWWTPEVWKGRVKNWLNHKVFYVCLLQDGGNPFEQGVFAFI